MAKIERVEDLPDWFDLEKYRGVEKFRASEWLEQLRRRHSLLDLHPSRVNYRISNDLEDWQSFVSEFWAISIRDEVDAVRKAPLNAPASAHLDLWASELSPVKPVCALDLLHQADRDLSAEQRGQAPIGTSSRWTVINPTWADIPHAAAYGHQHLSLNYYQAGSSNIPIVKVDLGATDAVLKVAFSAWLEAARKEWPTTRTTRGSLYNRWARYGVLPFIDLHIWAMETNSHIPDRVMSSAISHYDAGEANLRKTVAPLAESLMRDLSELAALAAIEVAKQAPTVSETFPG